MKCPVCKDVNLVMAERQGVEIDYCPDCRGVWLDRGELDKIIDKSAGEAYANGAPSRERQAPPQRPGYGHHDDDDHRYNDRGYQHKKKKSLLSEIFDFD